MNTAHIGAVLRFEASKTIDKLIPKSLFFMLKSPCFPLEPIVGKILHYPNSQKGMYDE